MLLLRRFFWPLLTTIAVGVLGFISVDNVRDWRAAPQTPTMLTLAQVHAMSPLPAWVEITNGQVRCDLLQRVNKVDAVPVVEVDSVDDSGGDGAVQPMALWISLEEDELCATVPTPVRVSHRNSTAFHGAVLDRLQQRGVVVGGTVFTLEDDAPGRARNNLVGGLVFLFGALFALAFQLNGRRRRPNHNGLRAVGDAGAAPAGGVLAAIVSGSTVSGGDGVLPAAPLVVSAAAASMAFRQKYIGPALLVVSSIGMLGLGGYATVGIVDDLRAWHQGVQVPAELKGSTSTKLVLSFVDVELAWQMPGETTVRHQSRWFMTLWMPDDDSGAVRALVSDPSVVTFEEAVDLVPLRAPLVLGLFAFAVGALVAARNQRRSANRVVAIAATAVESRLVCPEIVTMTTNGTVTGYALSGLLDGLPVAMQLATSFVPSSLIVADDSGAILVARTAEAGFWTPVRVDGEPFAWRGVDLARAQAVLIARGSPSILVEPAG